MCEFILEKTDIKTPYIAALLGLINYSDYCGMYITDTWSYMLGGEKFKSVSDISLMELNDMDTSFMEIGCLRWFSDKTIKALINYYLE